MMKWNELLSTTRVADMANPGSDSATDRSDHEWSEFDNDYGRAIFSSPVRRLQDKTQVFPMDPTDAVRTRLTHSLEVSSVARGLARRVAQQELKNGAVDAEQARSIETIAATVGLLHDLGNPPFGHAGESAMRDWFASSEAKKRLLHKSSDSALSTAILGDFEKFEGNAQTIRLVSKLQLLVRTEGLNLTCGTMSALLKYAAGSGGTREGSHALGKPGYFESERDLVDRIRSRTGVPSEARNPITLLMEAADDICFSVVDIEDAIKKGVATWDAFCEHIGREGLGGELIRQCASYVESHGGKSGHRGVGTTLVQLFRVELIRRAVPLAAKEFGRRREQIMTGRLDGYLLDSKTSDAGSVIAKCKSFAVKCVYNDVSIMKLEMLGRRVIEDLMDFFWMGAEAAGPGGPAKEERRGMARRAYSLISENYRLAFEASWGDSLPDDYKRLQLVTDQVCGMTDSYACRLHEEIRGG